MPYAWIDPDCLIAYKGICVYHTYRNDDYDAGPMENWYTQHLDGANQFDIRDFDCYDARLSHEEIMIRAIDSGELPKEVY